MSLPTQADVAVVGAGILGTASAYLLARSGRRVVLAEASRSGRGTADASGWSVIRQTKIDAELLELTERSMVHWRGLAADAGVPYEQAGSDLLFRDDDEEAVVAERVAWLEDHGVDVRMLGQAEIRDRQPAAHPDVRGASHVASDGEVDPVVACDRLVAALRSLDVPVLEDCPVRRILMGEVGAEGIETADGTVRALHVVIAAGPATPGLLASIGAELPLRLQKGEQLVTAPTDLRIAGRVISARYLVSKRGAGQGTTAGLAVGQGPDGRIRIGSTRSLSDEDPAATDEGREALLAEVRPYLAGVAELGMQRQTVGFRVVSALGRPLVGPLPGVDGISVLTGHGGDGIALAALSAAVLRDRINDDEPETTRIDVPPDAVTAVAG